jgi:hypothetical protein
MIAEEIVKPGKCEPAKWNQNGPYRWVICGLLFALPLSTA